MSNHTMTTGAATGLLCHWVPVTDASGRTHLEARWSARHDAVRTPHAA
jgi:hypothetical protein